MELLVERSKSRTGMHQRRALYFVTDASCREVKARVISERPVKPLYSKGEAKLIEIRIPENAVAIQLDFRRNWRGKVVGEFTLFDSRGNILGRGVYRKLKVRLVEATSESILELVKCVFRKLKLLVKRYAIIRK